MLQIKKEEQNTFSLDINSTEGQEIFPLNITEIKDEINKKKRDLLDALKEENINWNNKKGLIEQFKQWIETIATYKISLQEKNETIRNLVFLLSKDKNRLEIMDKIISESGLLLEKLKNENLLNKQEIQLLLQKKKITKKVNERRLENSNKINNSTDDKKTGSSFMLVIVLPAVALILILSAFFVVTKTLWRSSKKKN